MAALAASPFVYRKVFFRVEEEVRSRVEAELNELLADRGLLVRVRSAHLSSEGIEVRGLSISEPDAPGPQPEIVYVDEAFFFCRTSPQELLTGEPEITNIQLTRPIVRATHRPDGSFSASKLFPLPKPKHAPPRVTIESGMVVVFDPLKNPSSTFTLREINLTVTPPEATGEQTLLEVQGYLKSDAIQRIEIVGTADPESGSWTLSGTVDALEISPELMASLPERVSKPLKPLEPLRAGANLSFHVTGTTTEQAVQFEVNGQLIRGTVDDPRLPYPLTEITGQVHCTNAGFTISDLTARHGATVWQVPRLAYQGFGEGSPFDLHAIGHQVHLDRKWVNSLSEPWRTHWRGFDPEGDIDLVCTLSFDGERYRPKVEATCLNNVSFTCNKFPYRLEQARGKLTLIDNALCIALTAYSGPQPVTLTGNFINPGPEFVGWMEIRGDKIQFDERLFAAIPKPKARETLVSLNPRGSFNFYTKVWRDDPAIAVMHQYLEVKVDRANRCSLSYDKFPYPLSSVQGTLEMRNGQWTFNELVGSNGTGLVTLSGSLDSTPEADVLSVTIDARNVPLQEELRNALQPSLRGLWDSLQPHGKLDVRAGVRFDSRTQRTSLNLRAWPRDDASPIGTSIEPVTFPYRMRLRSGYVDYFDGHAELRSIEALHGATQMRANGTCDISPEGAWQLKLSDLTVDRLRLQGDDHELERALPEGLRRALNELKPEGPINLTGAVNFSKRAPDAPLFTGWDVRLVLNQASLQVGPRLENIFGRVRLRGSALGDRYTSTGELELDSLMYKNFQFTQIGGPFTLDNERVFFGAWGPRAQQHGAPSRHITARLLGGMLTGDCQVQLGPAPHYHLAATLSGADLGQFARENLANQHKLKGKILANIELNGSRGPRNLAGVGHIHLTEADVYELPVMVSLLKIMRAKPPDATAFTQSDIAFEIQQGENIILRSVQLDGDAISLSGHGELKLDGHTNPITMQLHTSMGRGNLPLLSGLLSEASQQILLIHVGGTLENPSMRTEPFPVANQALQQLQADSNKAPLFPQAGEFMRSLRFR